MNSTITNLSECNSIDDVVKLINNAGDENFIHATLSPEMIAAQYAINAAKDSLGDESSDRQKMDAEIEAQLDLLSERTDSFYYSDAWDIAFNIQEQDQ